MNKVYIPYGSLKSIKVEITNNLNLDKLVTKPNNTKYWGYSDIAGGEEYRKYIAILISKMLNTNKDIYVSDVLKRVYEVDSLEELECHYKKLKTDYSAILKNVYTIAKNDEIQKYIMIALLDLKKY